MVSVLFMGCYSSAMLVPTDLDKGQHYSGNIEYIVTNDSTKYVFDFPPAISNNAIVGMSNTRQMSIPLADVSKICVKESHATPIVFGIVAFAITVGLVAVTASEFKVRMGNALHP